MCVTKMSTKIADILCQKGLINESDKEIYAFGYEVIFDNVLKLIAIFLAGVFIHRVTTTVIFLVTFVTIRSHTGGYHAKSKWICSLVSLILWGIVVVTAEYMTGVLKTSKVIIFFMVLVSELIIHQYAPVENINKRLTEEKRLRNRRRALVLGIVYGILVLLLTFIAVEYSVAMAMTLLEVAILMIIPNEGRINHEETGCFRKSA